MEKSTHQVSSHLPLQQLVAGAVSELERLGYSRKSLWRYRVAWRHLIEFCHEMSMGDEYSLDLAKRFCSTYQVRADECLNYGQGWRRNIVFSSRFSMALRMKGILSAPSLTSRRYKFPHT